jgi:hypothetical protein
MWLWWIIALPAIADPPLVGPDASASVDVGIGEYNRLSQELERLASKNAWAGVERTFQLLVETGVEPSFDDWVRGADAARARGDLAAAHSRLTAANAIREDRTVLEGLWDIDSRYGRVSLLCDADSYIELEPEHIAMDPDLLRSIEFAKARIHDGCRFVGLLPVGTYRFLDELVVVDPRVPPVQVDLRGIEIDRRTRRDLRRRWLTPESD